MGYSSSTGLLADAHVVSEWLGNYCINCLLTCLHSVDSVDCKGKPDLVSGRGHGFTNCKIDCHCCQLWMAVMVEVC